MATTPTDGARCEDMADGFPLTRRQLLGGGLALGASLVTGTALQQGWALLQREDLIPGTPPDIVLQPHRWTTTDDRVTFAALGDGGSGGRQAMRVAEQMARTYQRTPFGSVSLLGDICYYGRIEDRFEQVFLAPLGPLIDAGVEFELSIGNHDGPLWLTDERLVDVEATLDLLGTPARYYAVGRGPVDFAYLDTFAIAEGWDQADEQLEWLDRTLAAMTRPWRVVCTHHPVYSSGRHGPTPRLPEVLEPILRRHRVDLVLSGHDHHYERTVPIDGITYVVSGAGCKLTGVDPQPWTAVATSTLQFMLIEVRGSSLRARSISDEGAVIDDVELTARRRA